MGGGLEGRNRLGVESLIEGIRPAQGSRQHSQNGWLANELGAVSSDSHGRGCSQLSLKFPLVPLAGEE